MDALRCKSEYRAISYDVTMSYDMVENDYSVAQISYDIVAKMHKDAQRCTKMHTDAQRCTKMHKDAHRCTKMHKDAPTSNVIR